jgi:hypothetical protein
MPDDGPLRVSDAFRRLARRSRPELDRLFAGGAALPAAALAGSLYAGYNTPVWAEALRIRKFLKGFAADGAMLGHNTPVRQNGLDADWQPLPSAEAPKRFGFFRVASVGATLLFDYDVPENPRLGVTRRIRDVVVALEPGSPDVLLGTAYLAIGARRVPAGFFLLERLRGGPGQTGVT